MFIPLKYTIYSWSPPELSPAEKHWLSGEIARVGKRSFTLALKRKMTATSRNETDSSTYHNIIRNAEALNVAEKTNVSQSEKIRSAIILSIFAILVAISIAAMPTQLKVIMLIAFVAIIPITFGSLYLCYRDIDRWTQKLLDDHAAAIATLDLQSNNPNRISQQVPDPVGETFSETNTEDKTIPTALEWAVALPRLFKSGTALELIDLEGARWINEFLKDGAHPLAPPELKAEALAVREYVGMVDGLPLTGFQTRKFTARFETYLFEHTAPNAQLASVFGHLRSWLTTAFRTLDEGKAPISEDIRVWYAHFVSVDPEPPVLVPDRAKRALDEL
jgi:hypothetical protein